MDTRESRADTTETEIAELRARMAKFAYDRACREAEDEGGEVIFEAGDVERIMAQVGFPAVEIPAPRSRSWAWWVPVPAVVVAIAFVAMMAHRKSNPPGANDFPAPVIALAPAAEAPAAPAAAAYDAPLRDAPARVAATLPVPVLELGPAEPVQKAVADSKPDPEEKASPVARAEVRTASAPPASGAKVPAATPVPTDVRGDLDEQLGTSFEDEQAPVAAAEPVETPKSIDELLDDGAGDMKKVKEEKKAAAPSRKAIDRGEVKKAIARTRRYFLNCATRAQVHGTTTLKFTVAPTGKLTSARIKGALAGTPFASCAETAARKMSFEPYDGAPTSFTIPVPLDL